MLHLPKCVCANCLGGQLAASVNREERLASAEVIFEPQNGVTTIEKWDQSKGPSFTKVKASELGEGQELCSFDGPNPVLGVYRTVEGTVMVKHRRRWFDGTLVTWRVSLTEFGATEDVLVMAPTH